MPQESEAPRWDEPMWLTTVPVDVLSALLTACSLRG